MKIENFPLIAKKNCNISKTVECSDNSIKIYTYSKDNKIFERYTLIIKKDSFEISSIFRTRF